jgi:hypothetical protein
VTRETHGRWAGGHECVQRGVPHKEMWAHSPPVVADAREASGAEDSQRDARVAGEAGRCAPQVRPRALEGREQRIAERRVARRRDRAC